MSGGELIARLEAAKAGSRELDRDIAVLLDGFFTLPPRYDGGDVGYGYIDDDGTPVHPGHGGDQLVRHYTTSLDAALALAERVLPDFWWIVRSDERGGFANVGPNADSFKGNTAWPTYAATPALAMCIAILRATPTGEPEA